MCTHTLSILAAGSLRARQEQTSQAIGATSGGEAADPKPHPGAARSVAHSICFNHAQRIAHLLRVYQAQYGPNGCPSSFTHWVSAFEMTMILLEKYVLLTRFHR